MEYHADKVKEENLWKSRDVGGYATDSSDEPISGTCDSTSGTMLSPLCAITH